MLKPGEMGSSRAASTLLTLFQVGISSYLLLVLYRNIDPGLTLRILLEADPILAAVAVLLIVPLASLRHGSEMPATAPGRYARLIEALPVAMWAVAGWALAQPRGGILPAPFWGLLAAVTTVGAAVAISDRLARRVPGAWGLATTRSSRCVFPVLLWLLHLVQIWLFTVALGHPIPFAVCASLCGVAVLAGRIPLTFAGIGARDYALVVLLGSYIAPEAAAALGVLMVTREVLPRVLTMPATWRDRLSPLRADLALVVIVLLALCLRIDLASARPYLHDEANTAIPLARTISFTAGALNLPLRGENHGALPAYIVKASGALFGTSPRGYRMLHVLLGIAAIVLVAAVAREWYGPVAARWAAALLAFNEYFFFVSSHSTAHVPYLFCVAFAAYCLSRLLTGRRVVFLYLAAAAAGVAFYSKEHAALLVPLLGLTVLRRPYRAWLRSPHPYLAGALFAAFIVPDVMWNLRTERTPALATYSDQVALYATYNSHLKRVGGLGVSPYPLVFYGRSAVLPAYRAVTGTELRDETPEYASVNPLLGLVLLGGVVAMTARGSGPDMVRPSLLFLFWGVFGFFTLIKPGSPPGRLDPVSWIWVESTLIPAVILTAGGLATIGGRLRVAVWGLAIAAVMYGGWHVYQ
jgi:hypothetical protein